MQLMVLGLNHKTAPVDIREHFNFSTPRTKNILRRLRNFDELTEAVIVSTCNRTEIYLVTDSPNADLTFLRRLLVHVAGPAYSKEYFYTLTGINCIRHLFRVAASLDSLIIGEGQILSQIKEAYQLARHAGMTATLLNTLFNRAIAVGKKVRTATHIAYSSVSVSSAAVDLAQATLQDLATANILVIGAGKMSELTTRHLIDKGASKIQVSNRSLLHAQELATRFNGKAVPFEDFLDAAAVADIIITSTGAPHYVVTFEDFTQLMAARPQQPLILIDIAVPRDVEPQVGEIAGIKLYNIDDLESVVDVNKELRAKEAEAAVAIIEEEIITLRERLRYLSMRPVMVQLSEKMDFLRERVLKRTLVKLPNLSEKERRIIERMSERLTNKFLREPMTAMNTVAGTKQEEYYRNMISELFLLGEYGGDGIGDETKYDYWD
ncbi:MAG: glutamyl-tRNA reductase [Acidaminococcaceae bacterium]